MQTSDESKQSFYPGYFAVVMATGIISSALTGAGDRTASILFLFISVILFILLVSIYFIRTIRKPKNMWADFIDPTKMFGFLTFVAGTNVLSTGFALQLHWYLLSVVMGVIAAVIWVCLMYFMIYRLVFYNERSLPTIVNGSWLLVIVSTESVSAWASAIITYTPLDAFWLLFLAYACWAVGIFIYVIFIGLIFMRLFFYRTSSTDVDAPYWINMGAMAIATLSGSRLVLHPNHQEFLLFVKPMIEGLTVTLWAWGTWWIPFLILVGIKKYIRDREVVKYHPSLWGMVFPIGMYTAATDTLSTITGLRPLDDISRVTLWFGIVSWASVALLFIQDTWVRKYHL